MTPPQLSVSATPMPRGEPATNRPSASSTKPVADDPDDDRLPQALLMSFDDTPVVTADLSGTPQPSGVVRSLATPSTATENLGRYKLLREIGSGGMGTVYEAMDTTLQRAVALKILNPDIAGNSELLRRFRREARAAGRLNHINVVRLLDLCVYDQAPVMVMELVSGCDLWTRVTRQGPLPWPLSLSVVTDVARGLSAAHEIGIIHRDIKPANVLISDQGHVKIADFGLVKFADAWQSSRSAMSSLSASLSNSTNSNLGTPCYMSPEQCRGEEIDHRSDIYSLGLTWLAIMTGHIPFDGRSLAMVLMAQCYEELPDPRQVNPDIPEAVVAVLRRATAKAPEQRYQTAGALLMALEALGQARMPLPLAPPSVAVASPAVPRRQALAVPPPHDKPTPHVGMVVSPDRPRLLFVQTPPRAKRPFPPWVLPMAAILALLLTLAALAILRILRHNS